MFNVFHLAAFEEWSGEGGAGGVSGTLTLSSGLDAFGPHLILCQGCGNRFPACCSQPAEAQWMGTRS